MTKEFTKGQKVTIVANWNRLGDFTTREAIVYSCGKKQMILTDVTTGEEIGRNFKPTANQNGFNRIVADASKVEEIGLEMIAAHRAHEIAHYNRCLTNETAGEAYRNSIRKDLDAVQAYTPRLLAYADALAAIRAAMKK